MMVDERSVVVWDNHNWKDGVMNLEYTLNMADCNRAKLKKSWLWYYLRNLEHQCMADWDVQIIKCHWSKNECSFSDTRTHTRTQVRISSISTVLWANTILAIVILVSISRFSYCREWEQTADAQMKCNHRTKWSSYACVKCSGLSISFQPQKSPSDFKLLMLFRVKRDFNDEIGLLATSLSES